MTIDVVCLALQPTGTTNYNTFKYIYFIIVDQKDVNHARMATISCSSKIESTERSGVFFVYKTISPDKDWVKSVAERLEKEGQKCFYHEPGRTIIENIVRFLQRSSKVIVVLTPAFLRSQWVEFETQINIEKPSQLTVIPVLLEDCEIPRFLNTTTYLDVQNKTIEEWWNVLQESLKTDGNSFTAEL
jgi:hypothetical protein